MGDIKRMSLKRLTVMWALIALLGGCGGPVTYNQSKDRSSLILRLGPVPYSDQNKTEMSLYASGKSRAPVSWECALFFNVIRPAASGPSLGKNGEKATLGFHQTNEKSGLVVAWDGGEFVSFDLALADLVTIAEQKRFKLNGKEMTLTEPQVDELKQAINALRGTTES
jgi:hypothetical protein